MFKLQALFYLYRPPTQKTKICQQNKSTRKNTIFRRFTQVEKQKDAFKSINNYLNIIGNNDQCRKSILIVIIVHFPSKVLFGDSDQKKINANKTVNNGYSNGEECYAKKGRHNNVHRLIWT